MLNYQRVNPKVTHQPFMVQVIISAQRSGTLGLLSLHLHKALQGKSPLTRLSIGGKQGSQDYHVWSSVFQNYVALFSLLVHRETQFFRPVSKGQYSWLGFSVGASSLKPDTCSILGLYWTKLPAWSCHDTNVVKSSQICNIVTFLNFTFSLSFGLSCASQP